MIGAVGLEAEAHDLGVTVADTSPEELKAMFSRLQAPLASSELSSFVGTLQEAKFDEYAPLSLLGRLWERANSDLCDELPRLAAQVGGRFYRRRPKTANFGLGALVGK